MAKKLQVELSNLKLSELDMDEEIHALNSEVVRRVYRNVQQTDGGTCTFGYETCPRDHY